MRGQAINIDSTIALALFLFTAVGTIAAVQAQRGDAASVGRSSQVADRIEPEISVQVFDRDLLMSSPTAIADYPVDRELEFVDAAEPGSASFEKPADVNISTGQFVSILELRNRSLRLSYASLDPGLEGAKPANDLTASDDDYLNNSELRLSLGTPGLEGLIDRGLGRELVRERGNVSLPGNDFSTQEVGLSASSLSGDLTVYNGSPEFAVSDGPAVFRLKNLSTVYVLDENKTLPIDSGFDKTFSTRALAVTENPDSAENGGIVLAGNLSARVENVSLGVDVSVSFRDRLRVRVVDGLSEGYRRSKAERGHAKFGPVDRLQAAWGPKIVELGSLDDEALRTRLGIGPSLDYNISLGDLNSVTAPPWKPEGKPVDFNGTDVNTDGDLVLNTTADLASYNQSYSVDDVAVTRAIVSGVDRPEDVFVDFQIDTPRNSNSFRLSNGTQVFRFDTSLTDSFEVKFQSQRTAGGDGNWTVDSYKVFYGNALEKGATLPPRADVDTETRVLPFADANITVSPSVLEVRTWS